jgi:hypothetical protein
MEVGIEILISMWEKPQKLLCVEAKMLDITQTARVTVMWASPNYPVLSNMPRKRANIWHTWSRGLFLCHGHFAQTEGNHKKTSSSRFSI